ncbi:hypothetical protein ACQ86N_21515 [Puia sp. P3]|uniref:hypothetical protein n=1 Tax=Puia sp. P3 TaxID=3423952 RepID=UPI003D66A526
MRHLLIAFLLFIATGCLAQPYLSASRQLIQRILPQRAGAFIVEPLPREKTASSSNQGATRLSSAATTA